MTSFAVIIVAAGSGQRFQSALPKQYVQVGHKPLLRYTLDIFASMPECSAIQVVIDPQHCNFYDLATKGLSLLPPVPGGRSRKESVALGLNALSLNENDIVLIHDAARPLVKAQDIRALLEALSAADAATLASPVSDTLRYADEAQIAGQTVSRDSLWAIQTPQAFRFGPLQKAHAKDTQDYTDDTALVSAHGIPVKFVRSTGPNFKITVPEDLMLAEHLLSSHETWTGTGYDVHAFDADAKDVKSVRLCGVDVPFDRKLAGHSDADVGLHALTDALLGAIGEGDIGLHFPPSNMDFKNMDSAIFLQHAVKLMQDKGGRLINADITLICEKPKLGSNREAMRSRVADILGISPSRVNIKATTTEKLGFTGRMEGIAAQASASVSMPTGDA